MMKSFDDDRHVGTRLAQYDAVRSEKGIHIAKAIIRVRIHSQNTVIEKHNLTVHDLDKADRMIDALDNPELEKMRSKLIGIEGRFTYNYWIQIMSLVPAKIRPEKRKKVSCARARD